MQPSMRKIIDTTILAENSVNMLIDGLIKEKARLTSLDIQQYQPSDMERLLTSIIRKKSILEKLKQCTDIFIEVLLEIDTNRPISKTLIKRKLVVALNNCEILHIEKWD